MYSFESIVRYSEVDDTERLSLTSVVNYLQDCSAMQSDALGIGAEELVKRSRAWYLLNWQIKVNEYPRVGTKIKISTWPYAFKRFLGYRNFIIQDENGNNLIEAASLWAFMDTQRMRPTKAEGDMIEPYIIEPQLENFETDDRKILSLEDGDKKAAIQVKRHNIDVYSHMNNGQYVKVAMDYVGRNFNVEMLRIEYKKSARLGDEIIPYVKTEETKVTVDLKGTDGETYAIAVFTGKEQQ